MKISPSIKGLITGAVMIAIVLGIYKAGDNADRRLQYLVYISYALGVIWTIMAYRMSADFKPTFGAIFNQGFRCFVVVTLVMAVFYGVFNYQHPKFAAETSQAYREQLVKENEKTPPEIESAVTTFKKQYTLKLVSGAIFGYLIIGAGVTAVLSALLIKRK